ECTRQTGHFDKELWPLTPKTKRHAAAERRAHGCRIRSAYARAIFSIDQRLEPFDKKPAVVLITGHGVLVHAIVRMNSDNDDFLDGVHLIQHVNQFVSPPC